MRNDELILIAGVEGGGIALHGSYEAQGWRFKVSYSDSSKVVVGRDAIHVESDWISGWPAALDALDRYSWHRLPAAMVKREFRDLVWQAVERRIATDRELPRHRSSYLMERWRDRCAAFNEEVSLDP